MVCGEQRPQPTPRGLHCFAATLLSSVRGSVPCMPPCSVIEFFQGSLDVISN